MKKGLTELVFILDRSGSMAGLETDTIGGFNAMLKKQRKGEGECRITTVLFDHEYELLHDRIDIRAVSPMTGEEYFVRGSTALLDTVGWTIQKLVAVQRNTAEEYRAEKVLFVIITDGYENASREFSASQVKAMIQQEQEEYGWEFIFLGANIDAVETAGAVRHPDRPGDGLCARRPGYGPELPSHVRDRGLLSGHRGCSHGPYGEHPQRHEKTRWEKMIEAIIGDIVGSGYEWHNIKIKDFPLFREDCFFTDDTVMTVAVAEALMKGGREQDFITAMKQYGRLYPGAGYGGRFGGWLFSDSVEPYNSWGNGSTMRVAAVGWWAKSLDEALELAKVSAAVTHNHPEGIKGAQTTAACIYLARTGSSKADIRDYIEETFGYDLSRTLDEIRPGYQFNESCQDTVPQVITAFMESADFEDAIRNAISLGGDSDTLTAITGSIAEGAYGVPEEIRDRALTYLDKPQLEVVKYWESRK